ncbi:MAG: hypothetical protein ACREF4_16310 [Gammaproteobacteria bacterium]
MPEPVRLDQAIRDLFAVWPGDPDEDLRMDLESQLDLEAKQGPIHWPSDRIYDEPYEP